MSVSAKPVLLAESVTSSLNVYLFPLGKSDPRLRTRESRFASCEDPLVYRGVVVLGMPGDVMV